MTRRRKKRDSLNILKKKRGKCINHRGNDYLCTQTRLYMDILMIVLSVMGLGFLTVGSGAVAKDAATKLIAESDTKPNPKTVLNLRKFLRVLGIYLLVYVCLNIVTLLVFLLTGQVETLYSLRETIIEYDLLLSLPITWLIIKYGL